MLHKFAITNTIFAKSVIPDVYHRITDMYINFQQKWVSKSVKTVRTNIFAKKCKLHKFATMPIILFYKSITSDMHHHKTYMYINLQQNRVNMIIQNCAHKLICKNLQTA